MTKTEQARLWVWRCKVLREASSEARNIARTCRHFGISRQAFYRWKRRFEATGEAGLWNRSTRPHRSPTWAVFRGGPLPLTNHGQSCAVDDQMHALVARASRMVRRIGAGAHHGQGGCTNAPSSVEAAVEPLACQTARAA